jgi:hypothetical protein
MEEEMDDIEEWFRDFVDECSSRGGMLEYSH